MIKVYALLSMLAVYLTVAANLCILFAALETQLIWDYIDEGIFCFSNIIMCLAILLIFIEVFVYEKFHKHLDILVFSYFLMWIISIIAVITSNYHFYIYHLATVILTFVAVILFSLCLTAKFYQVVNLKLKQQAKEWQEKTKARKAVSDCHQIPLTDDDHVHRESPEQDVETGRTAEKGTSFHGITTVL
nr:unnamed protein product [Callosobruchus chinensis]